MTEPVDKSDTGFTVRNPIGLLPGDQQTIIQLLAILGIVALFSTTWFVVRHHGVKHIDTLEDNQVTLEIDINRADWTEISALPKIGEATARDIVAYRKKYGPFTSLESLLLVDGIGSGTLGSIRPYLRTIPAREEYVAESPETSYR